MRLFFADFQPLCISGHLWHLYCVDYPLCISKEDVFEELCSLLFGQKTGAFCMYWQSYMVMRFWIKAILTFKSRALTSFFNEPWRSQCSILTSHVWHDSSVSKSSYSNLPSSIKKGIIEKKSRGLERCNAICHFHARPNAMSCFFSSNIPRS